MADPVTDQPSAKQEESADAEPVVSKEAEAGDDEAGGNIVKSTSWWGVSSLSSYLTSPHLLEQGINNMASSMAQVKHLSSPVSLKDQFLIRGPITLHNSH